MSECVVRMEMPQNCWVCPFGSDRFIWDENDGRPHYVMARFCSRHSGEEFHVLETDTIDRPWFCDSFICQLPEGHGRLGDLDALTRLMLERKQPLVGADSSKDRYRYMQWLADFNAIRDAKTIIPAEKGE